MRVSSSWLSTLFIVTNIYIYISSTESQMVQNFQFAYVTLGVVVAIELLTTTFLQSIIGKFNSSYRDMVLIGEADFILMFTVSALLLDMVAIFTTLIIHSFLSFIYDKFIAKESQTYTPMFPSVTIALALVFIFY